MAAVGAPRGLREKGPATHPRPPGPDPDLRVIRKVRLLDRDLALHAHLLVIGDRAVELVLPGSQVDLERAALAGRDIPLELLVVPWCDVLDLERVRHLTVVLHVEADLARLDGGVGGI